VRYGEQSQNRWSRGGALVCGTLHRAKTHCSACELWFWSVQAARRYSLMTPPRTRRRRLGRRAGRRPRDRGWVGVACGPVRAEIVVVPDDLDEYRDGMLLVIDQGPVGALRSHGAHKPLGVTISLRVRGVVLQAATEVSHPPESWRAIRAKSAATSRPTSWVRNGSAPTVRSAGPATARTHSTTWRVGETCPTHVPTWPFGTLTARGYRWL
jgi:hypothetical protein